MAFPYRKILILGATSGIGRALAASLIQDGRFVIAVGRRKEHLDSFVQEQGTDKAVSFQFDISRLDEIQSFVKSPSEIDRLHTHEVSVDVASVTSSHPDLDCVFVNSGIQRRSVFSEPETISMSDIQEEMTTRVSTSSNLALVPILRCSNYCASKAALHQWILCLREQLKGTNTKVIEIFPPIVQTELHDAKHQPDMGQAGKSFGIPVEQFTEETMERLQAGDEQIPVGLSKIAFESWEQQRQGAFHRIVELMKSSEF
ncbi:hypothetical protein PENSUB_13981 [Penicillium subrubescens]|uniref:Oxidoreductase DltE n=1 Tax=Penicillium subrubescens TaxID=1316194 RepID=A0A1Q5UPW7_9EURO|nr:hypothetical protein PENSUB_13981 [Penicillium subrubescens]